MNKQEAEDAKQKRERKTLMQRDGYHLTHLERQCEKESKTQSESHHNDGN
jgi:hypothetical protein